MKKMIVIVGIIFLLTATIVDASVLQTKNYKINSTNTDEFAHTVFAEFGSQSSCPYCPPASEQLYQIYESAEYDFQYVSIVFQKSSLSAQKRLQDLGITSVPDVFFDGKFTHIPGKQDDDQPYRDKINLCGSRDVSDIDLNVDLKWVGNAGLKITTTFQNNEQEKINGILRIYIVEKISRWEDHSGKPYHFAVLDMPVERDVSQLQKSFKKDLYERLGEPVTFTYTWFGSLYGFGDIAKDNTMVIACVFDKNTDYVFESASATIESNDEDNLKSEDGYTNITAQDAFESYLACYCNGVQIPIDIRTDEEWNTEHIETWGEEQEPVHWPNLQLGEGLEEFMAKYADKEVILYCRTASRTWTATKLLIDNGFTGKIYNMVGGITAWKDGGYPTSISVHKAYEMLISTLDGVQIPIDIRTEDEWDKEHIKTQDPQKAVNYPNLQLGVGINDFILQYDDAELVIYCNSGSRTNEVADLLIEKILLDEFQGYFHIMIGGMNAWKDAGYPTPKARPYSRLSLFFSDIMQKLLDICPNSHLVLKYLSGL